MDTYVEFFHVDKFKHKHVLEKVPYREFHNFKVIFLERSMNGEIGEVWYTYNNLTTKLDYYND
jgi:hypothetical protein